MYQRSVAIIFLITCSASYGLISFGSCPDKSPVANFDLARFSGFWYENRALEGIHLTQEGWGSCQTILFDSTTRKDVEVSEGNIFDFIPIGSRDNKGVNYTRETTTLSTLVFGTNHTGAINADFIQNRAEFKIHGTWRFLSIPVQTIRILATDYDNYAVLWTCQDMGNFVNRQNGWILTRSQNLSATVSSSIINSLFSQGLPETDFRVTDQSNCRARSNRKPFFSPLAFSQVKSAHVKSGGGEYEV